MFDIGWTEILVIATVAVVVVGPKDLPRMLRSFGKTMGQVRRMSNDFKRQFDEALREAERESGLEETRKDLQAMTKVADPLKDAKKSLDSVMRPGAKTDTAKADATKPAETAGATPAAAPAGVVAETGAKNAPDSAVPKPAPPPRPEPASAGLREAEPVKTAATGPGSGTA